MIIDCVYLILLIGFIIRGYSKGIIVAFFSLIAMVAGVIGALALSKSAARLLAGNGGPNSKIALLISYLIVFALIVFLVKVGAGLIQKAFEAIALGWVNRVCGALVYAFLLTFIFSTVLWLCNGINMIGSQTKVDSKIYSVIEPVAPKVFSILGAIFPLIKHTFEGLTQFFDVVNHQIPEHVGVN
jgi:membrane protein required for colicin V production